MPLLQPLQVVHTLTKFQQERKGGEHSSNLKVRHAKALLRLFFFTLLLLKSCNLC